MRLRTAFPLQPAEALSTGLPLAPCSRSGVISRLLLVMFLLLAVVVVLRPPYEAGYSEQHLLVPRDGT